MSSASARIKAAIDYWVLDTVAGGSRLAFHEILRALPIDACSEIGAQIVKVTRRLYPESEARARLLQRFLHPEQSQVSEDAAIERLWRNVSRTMTEYSVLDRLWPAHRIELHGLEHPRAARAADKPLLFVGLHLGNWETIGATLVPTGFGGAGFYEPPVNRFDHVIANRVRRRYGAKIVFPQHSAARTALRVLQKRDDVFLIYADEIHRGRVSAPALGRELKLEGNISHIARLARLTGAAVIPLYCQRIGDRAKFLMTFLPPVKILHSKDNEADLERNVMAINAAIEPIIRAHADQWYYALDIELSENNTKLSPGQ